MSSQSVRIQKFSVASLPLVGTANTRTTHNLYFKSFDEDFKTQWEQTTTALNATFKTTKVSTAFEVMTITSDEVFFKNLGFKQGKQPPINIMEFFACCYKFAIAEIGYHCKDENIISAFIQLDTTTPTLKIYYIPIVDSWDEKVYALNSSGKVLRNDKGSPIQARNEFGVLQYKRINSPEQPKISSTSFWAERGKKQAYNYLQDSFFEQVGCRYNLARI
jgi:hypothetical protein